MLGYTSMVICHYSPVNEQLDSATAFIAVDDTCLWPIVPHSQGDLLAAVTHADHRVDRDEGFSEFH